MLNKGMSPLEILDILKTGKSIEYVVTFPEGHNMYEMAEILHKKGFIKKEDFLKQASDKAFIKGLLGGGYETLEGYLFPDTYNISKATSAKSFIKTMVQKFLDTYKALKNGKMTRHQVVTLASIIEKETGAPEERPLISSVFHNRLRKSMRLQTDPTVLYGIMDKTGSMKKNITRKDLTTPTRYNTYTFKGLPHGPIANPGIMSLRAALSPSTSEFLYFVSKNDGTHEFTTKYKDHVNAVRKFQLNRKMRQGKSWRDLGKKKSAKKKSSKKR